MTLLVCGGLVFCCSAAVFCSGFRCAFTWSRDSPLATCMLDRSGLAWHDPWRYSNSVFSEATSILDIHGWCFFFHWWVDEVDDSEKHLRIRKYDDWLVGINVCGYRWDRLGQRIAESRPWERRFRYILIQKRSISPFGSKYTHSGLSLFEIKSRLDEQNTAGLRVKKEKNLS